MVPADQIRELAARYRSLTDAAKTAWSAVHSSRQSLEACECAEDRVRREANEARRALLRAIEGGEGGSSHETSESSQKSSEATESPVTQGNALHGKRVRFRNERHQGYLVTHVTPFGMLKLQGFPGEEFSPDLVEPVDHPQGVQA